MQRVIILGASNVTLGFPLIVEGLRRSLPVPIELFAAHGHGRSYGLRSRVLMRRLPAIRNCGLWDALNVSAETSAARPLALITDVGNDLLFGVQPETLLSWVEECIGRLQAQGAAVTLATLPIESTLQMSAARFHATRTLFFPGGGPGWNDMKQMVTEVDSSLRQLAGRLACRVVSPRREWYGIDPIHVRRRHRAAAWSEILSTWPAIGPIRVEWTSAVRGLPYWRLAPAERDLWGRTHQAAQPAWKDAAGSSIWLY